MPLIIGWECRHPACLPASCLASESLCDCHPSACIFLSVSRRWPGLWCEWERRARVLLFPMQGKVSRVLQVGICKDTT